LRIKINLNFFGFFYNKKYLIKNFFLIFILFKKQTVDERRRQNDLSRLQ
jgi:hypothetical protein